jgi:hypothetical protein
MLRASCDRGGFKDSFFNNIHSQETIMKLLSVIALVLFTSVHAFADDAAAPAAAPAGEVAAPAAEAPAAPAEKAGKKAKKAKRVRKHKKAH